MCYYYTSLSDRCISLLQSIQILRYQACTLGHSKATVAPHRIILIFPNIPSSKVYSYLKRMRSGPSSLNIVYFILSQNIIPLPLSRYFCFLLLLFWLWRSRKLIVIICYNNTMIIPMGQSNCDVKFRRVKYIDMAFILSVPLCMESATANGRSDCKKLLINNWNTQNFYSNLHQQDSNIHAASATRMCWLLVWSLFHLHNFGDFWKHTIPLQSNISFLCTGASGSRKSYVNLSKNHETAHG
jgi:hypothetical protein